MFRSTFRRVLLGSSAATAAVYAFGPSSLLAADSSSTPGDALPGLRNYTMAEIAEHCSEEKRFWITYRHGVYDVTEFIAEHPGGDNIYAGVGSRVDPFWAMYAVHKTPDVLDILEKYRIGNISPKDRLSAAELAKFDEPYGHEPARGSDFTVRTAKPFNAEPPTATLGATYITPNDKFFVRNHLPVPAVVADQYRLAISGPGVGFVRRAVKPSGDGRLSPEDLKKLARQEGSVELTLDDLKSLPQHTVTTTVMCAGNRRSEFPPDTSVDPPREVKGTMWGPAAISTASWSGPRLRDVLSAVGVSAPRAADADVRHVVFTGLDAGPNGEAYAGSVPSDLVFARGLPPSSRVVNCLADRVVKNGAGGDACCRPPADGGVAEKCCRGDIAAGGDASASGDPILALEMNGKPIPADHGAPVRAVVPGVVGARNVKWLSKVVLSADECQGFWQQQDYRVYGRDKPPTNEAGDTPPPAIIDTPITSAILPPPSGRVGLTRRQTTLPLRGYAYSGGGRGVAHVEVTVDDGVTWHPADLVSSPAHHAFSWRLWTAGVPGYAVRAAAKARQETADSGELRVCVRAFDGTHNSQPAKPIDVWNPRGLLNNAYHCVPVDVP